MITSLVIAWRGSIIIVYTNLYYTSIPCAIDEMNDHLRCTYVVKISTSIYHMGIFSRLNYKIDEIYKVL